MDARDQIQLICNGVHTLHHWAVFPFLHLFLFVSTFWALQICTYLSLCLCESVHVCIIGQLQSAKSKSPSVLYKTLPSERISSCYLLRNFLKGSKIWIQSSLLTLPNPCTRQCRMLFTYTTFSVLLNRLQVWN